MSNEIKEILEDLDNEECYINNEIILTFDEAKTLLDYITNLQQENERLEENNQAMQEEMARVWEEKERLKQELKDRPFIDYTTDVYEELEDYKLRCEKASEYIKSEKEHYLTKGCLIADTNNANLIVSAAVNTCDCSLNILQNGSDSQ